MNAHSSSNWNDFNDAEGQQGAFDLIPKGTVVPLRMTIKPGGHDDPSQGWTRGYATQSFETGAVYLACEFVVTGGAYAKRKMWSNVGLHSQKGPTWGQMGRSFIRAALNSARNVHPQERVYRPFPPTPVDIDRMLETMRWVQWLELEQRHLVWMRAKRYCWRDISIRFACDRTTAWRRWKLAIETVTDRLNADQ